MNTLLSKKPLFFLSFLIAFGTTTLSCSSKPTKYDTRFQRDLDQKSIPRPEEVEPSEDWDRFYNEFFRFTQDAGDLPQVTRNIGESLGIVEERESDNVNSWDEVPDSSWFTNRIGKGDWTVKDSTIGPKKNVEAPELSGPWTIISGKADGVTAGFTVLDAKKNLVFVKFDPAGYVELASGAEAISSHILHAAGYNVPVYYPMKVPISIFKLGEKAKTKGKYGVKRLMTKNDLKKILATVPRDSKGRARISASLALKGKPMGPFMFEGTRGDDPNDKVDHEHRRELRALYVFGALINNTDIRAQNTLDMFIETDNEKTGYIRHNLIDFGTTLGAGGYRPKNEKDGNEFYVDWSYIGAAFASLGAYKPFWQRNAQIKDSAVGIFESEVFDPMKWKSAYPSPAYYFLTDRDAFWAAKIISKMTDEHIDTFAEQGAYSAQESTDRVARVLRGRRDKIVKAWFDRVTPLDDFSLKVERENLNFRFNDLSKNNDVYKSDDLAERWVSLKLDHSKSHQSNDQQDIKTDSTGTGVFSIPMKNLPLNEEFELELTLLEASKQKKTPIKIGDGTIVKGICTKLSQCFVTQIQRN